jgi:hypothetical protein
VCVNASEEGGIFAGLSIRDHCFFALFVLDDIRERFNEFNPLRMMFIQICLAFQKLQRFMVRMDDKFFWPKMMLPNLQNTNKSKKLFVID